MIGSSDLEHFRPNLLKLSFILRTSYIKMSVHKYTKLALLLIQLFYMQEFIFCLFVVVSFDFGLQDQPAGYLFLNQQFCFVI